MVIKTEKYLNSKYTGEKIVVRINKGEDKDTIVYSALEPDFSEGEKVLLFLARDDSDVKTDEDYYVVVGMKQGKYVLKDGNSSIYVNDDKEINLNDLKATINN